MSEKIGMILLLINGFFLGGLAVYFLFIDKIKKKVKLLEERIDFLEDRVTFALKYFRFWKKIIEKLQKGGK